MKTVMNHSQGGGLLKMIRRTDPVTKTPLTLFIFKTKPLQEQELFPQGVFM